MVAKIKAIPKLFAGLSCCKDRDFYKNNTSLAAIIV